MGKSLDKKFCLIILGGIKMTIELLPALISGLSVVVITFLGWLARLCIVNQGEIKNLGSKIDHMDEKMDLVIDSNTKLMKSHDDRITRLEKYFDVIMQTQIKKNDQLKMEI